MVSFKHLHALAAILLVGTTNALPSINHRSILRRQDMCEGDVLGEAEAAADCFSTGEDPAICFNGLTEGALVSCAMLRLASSKTRLILCAELS